MRPIPKNLLDDILKDDYYKRCCLTHADNKDVKIDFHHAWQYAGRQINEKWAIMPIWWKKHSPLGDKDSVHNCRETKEYIQYLSLLRADIKDLIKRMPRFDWQKEFNYLNKKYGRRIK